MPSHNQSAPLLPDGYASGMSSESTVSLNEIQEAIGENAPASLCVLLSHARRAAHAPQNVIYLEGNRNESVHFVTRGLLKLVAHLPNGRVRIVRLHRPGSIIGLSSLLGQRNEHSAVSVSHVHTLRLPVSALQRLRAEEPGAYVWLVECWHEYLREADTWITQFSTGPIRGRVARLLDFLSNIESAPAGDQVQLLTCEEMGAILGVTSESVSRTIADFKRQRILLHKQGAANEIYITDTERLRSIARE